MGKVQGRFNLAKISPRPGQVIKGTGIVRLKQIGLIKGLSGLIQRIACPRRLASQVPKRRVTWRGSQEADGQIMGLGNPV